jgi:hypothetical protein
MYPYNITNLPHGAFTDCRKLESLTLPSNGGIGVGLLLGGHRPLGPPAQHHLLTQHHLAYDNIFRLPSVECQL